MTEQQKAIYGDRRRQVRPATMLSDVHEQAAAALATIAGLMQGPTAVPRIALSIEETARAIGVSDNQVREAIRTGVLPVVRFGARRIVLVDSLRDTLKAHEGYLTRTERIERGGWR